MRELGGLKKQEAKMGFVVMMIIINKGGSAETKWGAK